MALIVANWALAATAVSDFNPIHEKTLPKTSVKIRAIRVKKQRLTQ